MTAATREAAASAWPAANEAFVAMEVARVRLRLERRVLWLRSRWRHDPLRDFHDAVISDAQADDLLSVEDRSDEAAFYRTDHAAAHVGRRIAELDEQLAQRRRAFEARGQAAAVDTLTRLFGLSPFERDVVLLCLAPELEPGIERLYAYVQDDLTCRHVTPRLALALLDSEAQRGPARRSFLPDAPLRRCALTALEPGQATIQAATPLRIDERVAAYLLGVNRIDPRAAELLEPVATVPIAPSQQELVDRLRGWLDLEQRRAPLPVLNLVGPDGAGRAAVAAALAAALGLQLCRLDAAGGLPACSGDRGALLRVLEREAVLLDLAFYLDATDLDPADHARRAAITWTVDQLAGFVVVAGRERWQARRSVAVVHVDRPAPAEQVAVWEQALDDTPQAPATLAALAQQFDLGPGAIASAVAAAREGARVRSGRQDAVVQADDLWQACRERCSAGLHDLAQRSAPAQTWDDIVLPADVLCQLQEIAAQVANRATVHAGWGFESRLNRGRGISALFAGPSGTGKTMAAEVLAGHLRLDLYRVDLAGVVSKYIGETEKNLRRVFDAAERAGAILFFDEADALFGKRTEVRDSHDRYANIEINYLLQRMEDYRGLAILATNMKSALDAALLRRLRFLVDFPFPDTAQRLRIWQGVFPAGAPLDGLDFSLLARLEIAGGNIKNIAVNAAFLSAAAGTPVRMSHVLHATRREYLKIDKLPLESEFGQYYAAVRR